MALTGGCRWKCLLCSLMTPRTRSPQAKQLYARAGRPNLFIKIPGTQEGLPAIEEAIFAGVPVNVTLLFSCEQYLAAADAYFRGIERRILAGLNPAVWSVGSVFISRWDKATMGKVPQRLAAPARDRRRQEDVQSLPPTARFGALAAAGQCRCASATPALGEHRHQRPRCFRRSLHQGARRSIHHQHDSRCDITCFRRPRRTG